MKMPVGILLFIVAVVVFICLFLFFARTILSPSSQRKFFGSVCIKENCFQVELAKTEAERDRGLMYRKELDKNKGMLFIFSAQGGSASGGDKEGIYPFWMKNTLIPLDMIWIDSNNKVVFIAQNVQPCKTFICPSVIPSAKSSYVLEINAGLCQEFGIKVGAELKINIE